MTHEDKLERCMEKTILKKYSLATIIDLLIPVIPVIYSYYYENLIIFEYLGFFELLGLIYLIFNLIAYIGTKANTVGGNLNKLFLIDIKTNNKNHLKNILRIVIISGFVFYMGSIDNFEFSIFIAFLFFILPMKFRVKDDYCYSILNRFLMLKYSLK